MELHYKYKIHGEKNLKAEQLCAHVAHEPYTAQNCKFATTKVRASMVMKQHISCRYSHTWRWDHHIL